MRHTRARCVARSQKKDEQEHPLYSELMETETDEDAISTDDEDFAWVQSDVESRTVEDEESFLPPLFSSLLRKSNAILWVSVAASLLYYTNFVFVAATCDAVYRIPMYLSLCGFGLVFVAAFYVGVCRPFLVAEEGEEDDLLPRCIFAFWNVWPFLIVFMMISFSLGLTHTGELLPGGVLGGLLMYAVLGLCLASPLLIQHKGLAHRPEVC
ncbi:hypothetical protein TGME49_272905 [Toxoplasma gondii ME49]|uniref:Transmembrane protein n=13 Tax=Toxoplasma gondii TaxID=5811 RepID=A0A125YPI9_TOXGV|nr:hypothetical protein TGME49_272905 [Toxoplasma gondii ME49]EPR64494.1 hypothetical protein TGGT1_272905 [Toxoplasma gondii GT1]ESS35963.1 putative transmembrane protein [Toxoplasma gondii VEG]KAF4642081.1 hypothetical protein TGRH88_078940 [Toxoplasma gondii]KFG43061.1 putative transmembrane protein [Toxoplasma gondii GAB2-2007-GAL-DOM2]KFG51708.1 putative transmembrane protein [Toxoplasma gondii p89]PUA92350.1 putative transmembrane protein [Toxoplasma gondii TgCATBr9]|eukprot:XP_018636713.1 hypothetical protein TGME49_272905 [Toxoplasma gondii ME49]